MSAGYARTTILAVALVLGVATATLLYVYATRKRPAEEQARAVVAGTYIPADTVISSGMVREVAIPRSDLEKDVLTSIIRATGMVTRTPFNKGEQITLSRVTDRATAFGLPALIPPGARAMSITVDSTDAVSGFIQPGQRVDIVASFAQGSDSVARTILQDVPLLAVNGSLTAATAPTAPAATAGKPKLAGAEATTSVTIAVTPAQAERLVAAQYRGKLKLGLRGINDSSRVATAGSSLNEMLGISREPPAGAAGAARTRVARPRVTVKKSPRSRPPSDLGIAPVIPPLPGAGPVGGQTTVRVIRGTQVEDVPVNQ